MIQNRIRKDWTDATLMNTNPTYRNLGNQKHCKILELQGEFILKLHFTLYVLFYLIFWALVPDLLLRFVQRPHAASFYQIECTNTQVHFLSFNTSDLRISRYLLSQTYRIIRLWRDLWKAFRPMPIFKAKPPRRECSGPAQSSSEHPQGSRFPVPQTPVPVFVLPQLKRVLLSKCCLMLQVWFLCLLLHTVAPYP